MTLTTKQRMDAALRELVEDSDEMMAPILRMIHGAPEGTFPCPNCCATASWNRAAQHWAATCSHCDWNAAGKLSAKKIAAN